LVNTIFVFGSNQAGRHGKGSALEARKKWGAVYGIGEGPMGRSYAIPTKDHHLRVRPLARIQDSVEQFLRFARNHPDYTFLVCRIGCMNAGYTDVQIAPFFHGAPENCELPEGWRALAETNAT
jgi:hypothetical protein